VKVYLLKVKERKPLIEKLRPRGEGSQRSRGISRAKRGTEGGGKGRGSSTGGGIVAEDA